jgi:hypothetical protein
MGEPCDEADVNRLKGTVVQRTFLGEIIEVLVEISGGTKVIFRGIASLRVRQAEPVQWSDTSLDCAEEGMMYAQVITPGYRVHIQTGARLYRVHVGKGRAVICGKPIDRSSGKLPKKAPSEDKTDIQGEVPDDPLFRFHVSSNRFTVLDTPLLA